MTDPQYVTRPRGEAHERTQVRQGTRACTWRRCTGWLARFTGPLLIVMISASCGFVIGVAASALPLTP